MSGAVALIDSHAHLTSKSLATDVGGVLRRASEAGVERVLTVSASLGDARAVADLAEQHDALRAAVGVHPHEAAGLTEAHEAELEELAARPRVLAIGEMGLDYHYDHSPRDAQRDAFRRQVRLARRVGLPIVVHAREADADTAAVLTEEDASDVGGVIHCFTSGWELARRCLELGFLVSFSGIVTFRDAESLRDVARRIPDDRLLVETDAPYLAPEPFRGKGPNEPARARIVAECVAGLRGTSVEELGALTTANFERVFGW